MRPNNNCNVFGDVIMTIAIARVHPVHFMNADPVGWVAAIPHQANRLGLLVHNCI